jgi:hypothetical protein
MELIFLALLMEGHPAAFYVIYLSKKERISMIINKQ